MKNDLALGALPFISQERGDVLLRVNADECGPADQGWGGGGGGVCSCWRIKISFGNGPVSYFPLPIYASEHITKASLHELEEW